MNNLQLDLYRENETTLQQENEAKRIEWDENFEQEFTMSARTAIARKGPSLPLKKLVATYPNLITGSALHYGKGISDHDSNLLKKLGARVVDYDFTYCPNPEALGNTFEFLWCSYVVNVLKPGPRSWVWQQMADCVSRTKGVAVVAARPDSDKGTKNGAPCEDGIITQKNTFQHGYELGGLKSEAEQYFKYVQEVKGCSGFRMVICSHNPINI